MYAGDEIYGDDITSGIAGDGYPMCQETDCGARPHRLVIESHDFAPPIEEGDEGWRDPLICRCGADPRDETPHWIGCPRFEKLQVMLAKWKADPYAQRMARR